MEVSKKGGKGAWWGRFLVVQTIPWNTGNKNQSYPGLKTRLTQCKNTYHAFFVCLCVCMYVCVCVCVLLYGRGVGWRRVSNCRLLVRCLCLCLAPQLILVNLGQLQPFIRPP